MSGCSCCFDGDELDDDVDADYDGGGDSTSAAALLEEYIGL